MQPPLFGISLEDSINEDSCLYEKVEKDEEYVPPSV
jgi:hypothetical protein